MAADTFPYFARNWREKILSYEDRQSQRRLESYGFTAFHPAPLPWEPTKLTPEIPINWLLDHLGIAYEFLRETFLHSKAPIPALLHACMESRRVLINAGYQLAFASRNHRLRTWFNFESDVLCLKAGDGKLNSSLLDYGGWGTGSFDPRSLQRVRKVAMVDGPVFSSQLSSGECFNIYIIDWDLSDFNDHFCRPSLRDWRFIPTEEVDALFSLVPQCPGDYVGTISMGYEGEQLAQHDRLAGEYFVNITNQIKDRVEADMRRVVADESIAPYQVPEVQYGHLCTEVAARRLINDRQEVWSKYELLMDKIKSPPRPTPMSPTDIEWQDDWEAFNEAHHSSPRDYPIHDWRPGTKLILDSTGSTAEISSTKIQPLESEVKYNAPYDGEDRGSAGSNRTIDQARINPLGGRGQHQHTAPHADSQGVVGTAEGLGKTKIEPLEGGIHERQNPRTGLDDEAVDGARIHPLGGVREQ
ncbi:hypothetical protein F5Y11DRAFT_348542 [Daldinia sp. FL1419]|nr:hypothetical protein F5Y11DRAFT_348542 [Daldinia sp. FL1419]